MRTKWMKRRGERGAAVVEFGIVTMILVPLVMFSMYFTDLAKARLKTAEIARYAMWELTSYPLSDYDKGSQSGHNALFDSAASNVASDVSKRYGDDLRADTENHSYVKYMTADWELDNIQITHQEPEVIPNLDDYNVSGPPLINQILDFVGGTINDIMGFWGFNKKGQAHVKVTMRFINSFIPRKHAQEFFSVDLFPDAISTLTLEDEYTMIIDSWTLLDGEDVYSPGSYQQGQSPDSRYYKQVNRLVWLGFWAKAQNFPLLGSLTKTLQKIQQWPVLNNIIDPCPPCTRLASKATRGDYHDANKVPINVDCGEGHNSAGIHSTPMRDSTSRPWVYMSSEYTKTYEKRGDWYMGCPNSQELNCAWK